MNKEEQDFESMLRSKLENHTVEVSDSVWSNIEKKQKKRDFLVWFRQYLNLFIALDIIVVSGFTILTFINTKEVQSENKSIGHIPTSPAEYQLKNEALISSDNEKTEISSVNEITSETPTPVLIKKSALEENTTNTRNGSANKSLIHKPYLKNEIKDQESLKTSIQANPVHKAMASEKDSTIYLAMQFIPSKHLYELNKENTLSQNAIPDSYQEVPVITPSVALNKPKKVVKAERENQEKLAGNMPAKTADQSVNKILQEKEPSETATATAIDATMNGAESPVSTPLVDTVFGKKKFHGYFAMDALVAPELAGRSLKGGNELVNNYITRRDSAEKTRFGIGAQVRFNFFMTKNFYLQSGLYFSQRKEKFSVAHKWQTHEEYIDSSKYVTYIDPFEGTIIYKTYDTLDYVRTHRDTINHLLSMTFLDVPLMMGYKWIGKRSGIAIQAGVIYNMLFKQKGSMADFNYVANDVQKNADNPFKTTTGLSIGGAIASNIKLSERMDLLIEPYTRYILVPVTKIEYPLEQKLFTYGLNLGLRLKL